MACFGPTSIYEDFDNALLRLRQPSWGLPPVTPIEAFWVTMANGERLDFREKYEGVRLFVQGLEFATTFIFFTVKWVRQSAGDSVAGEIRPGDE